MAPCRSRVGMKELFSTGSGILGRSFDIGDFPPRLRLREFLASALPVTKRQDGDHMRYSRKSTYHRTRNSWRFNYDNFVHIRVGSPATIGLFAFPLSKFLRKNSP